METIVRKVEIALFPNEAYELVRSVVREHTDTFFIKSPKYRLNKAVTAKVHLDRYLSEKYYHLIFSSEKKENIEYEEEQTTIYFDVVPIGTVKLIPCRNKLVFIRKTTLLFIAPNNNGSINEPDTSDILFLFIDRVVRLFEQLGALAPGSISSTRVNGPSNADRSKAMDKEKTMLSKKGRYRLTKNEIKFRKQQVKDAERVKKDNPLKYWMEIDKEFGEKLGISAESFRKWRHNNY